MIGRNLKGTLDYPISEGAELLKIKFPKNRNYKLNYLEIKRKYKTLNALIGLCTKLPKKVAKVFQKFQD